MGNMIDAFQLPENGMSLAETRLAIERLRGVAFTNRSTGIVARLSSSAKGKLVSNKATGKSKANGFTREQHNALAANIDGIYIESALLSSRPDRDGDANIISIKRFSRDVAFGNKPAVAWITVKDVMEKWGKKSCGGEKRILRLFLPEQRKRPWLRSFSAALLSV